jgi:hypothetical protein
MAGIIYLLEKKQQTAQKIVNKAIRNGYEIFIFHNFSQLLKELKKNIPLGIFLNSHLIPSSDDHLRVIKKFFTVIYGDHIDFDLKYRFYHLGIDRVINAEQNIETLLVQILHFHSDIHDNLKYLLNKSILLANLEEIQIKNVILNAIMNQRNLVLKVNDDNWYAKLRIFQGEIIEAFCSGKEGVNAVLNILQHPQGQLSIQSIKSDSEASSCDVSTFGMLVEGEFQQQILKEFQTIFGINNPVMKRNGKNAKNNITLAENNILQLVEKQIDLQSLIQDSPYQLPHTLHLIEGLLQKRLIHVARRKSSISRFNGDDVEFFRSKLFKTNQRDGHVMIIGTSLEVKHQFLLTMVDNTDDQIRSNNLIDMVHLELAPELTLHFIGIPSDANLQQLMNQLPDNVLAIFLIFDFARDLKFEYQKYYIKKILTGYDIPVIFGVVNITKFSERVLEEMRKRLEIPPDVKIIPFNPTDLQQIKQLFCHLVETDAEEIIN